MVRILWEHMTLGSRYTRGNWQYDDDLEDDPEFAEAFTPAPRRGGKVRPLKAKAKAKSPLPETDEMDDELSDALERKERERRRATISEPFKCRHCKAFIGEPPTGGRQRNHCPMCLYSLHVDDKTPGDRASECRSLMEPIGVFYRPSLEQVVVHRCLGCDSVRYNRVAADDNPVLLAELPVLDQNDLPERQQEDLT
jgi:hypothetical protein